METDFLVKILITMLSIINPLGVIPLFIALTKNSSHMRIKKIALSCAVTVAITLMVSFLIGDHILHFFGISIYSFTIGGGMLIFTLSFSMISAKQSDLKMNKEESEEYAEADDIGVVPLAIPLLAGPGAISTAIIESKDIKYYGDWLGVVLSLVIISLVIWVVLRYSRQIGGRLGHMGLNVMTRVMGLILLSLSIEMIVRGVKGLLPILQG